MEDSPCLPPDMLRNSPALNQYLRAYRGVGKLPEKERKDYGITMNDLSTNTLQSGIRTALAAVQRLGERGEPPFRLLACVGPPSLEDATDNDFPRRMGKQLHADADTRYAREAAGGHVAQARGAGEVRKEEQSSLPAQWLTMEGEGSR